LAHISRNVLAACRRASTSQEFANLFVKQVASETGSQFCLWTRSGASGLQNPNQEFIAHSGLRPEWFAECLEHTASAASGKALIRTESLPFSGIISLAAVPVTLHAEICGVLAVGNRPSDYDLHHLHALEEIGSLAFLRWEYLRKREAIGLDPASVDWHLADLVHDLRQPLSSIELLASLLEITLPANETRAREHLQEIRLHVSTVDCILSKRSGSGEASTVQAESGARVAPAVDNSRFAFRNDTISSVTH
jgi:hypothetical protein